MLSKKKYTTNIDQDIILIQIRQDINNRQKVIELAVNRSDKWSTKFKKEMDSAIRKTWID